MNQEMTKVYLTAAVASKGVVSEEVILMAGL